MENVLAVQNPTLQNIHILASSEYYTPQPVTYVLLRGPLRRRAGCAEVGVEGELAVYNPRGGGRKQFKFDRVFGSGATQAEVYDDTKFLIRSVLDGAQAMHLP